MQLGRESAKLARWLTALGLTACVGRGGFEPLPPIGSGDPQAIGDGADSVGADPELPLSLTPSALQMNLNSRVQLTATGGRPAYAYAVVAGPSHSGRGSVDASGLYTSPPNPTVVTVRVTDDAGSSADAVVTVDAATTWILGGDVVSGPTSHVYGSTDPTAATPWTLAPLRLPQAGEDMAGVVYRDELWLLGGYDGTNNQPWVWRAHDPGAAAAAWTATDTLGAPAPTASLGDASAAVFGDRIWFAGGTPTNGGSAVGSVWSTTDGATWQPEAPLPAARAYGTLLVFDARLWFLGGRPGPVGNQKDTIFVYDPISTSWQTHVGVLPIELSCTATLVFQDRVWLIAGDTPTTTVIANVWSSQDLTTWQAEAPLPAVRTCGQARATTHDLLYVGGTTTFASVTRPNTVYLYDGAAWQTEPTFPAGTAWGVAAAFDPLP